MLDEFLDTIKPYGDQIVPVHIEIYRAPTGTALVPTVEAWRLPSEPWVFVVDTKGKLAAKFEGTVTAGELADSLKAL